MDWTIAKGPLAVAEERQLAQETAPSVYERGELNVVVAAQIGLPLWRGRMKPSVDEAKVESLAIPEA